VRNELTRLAVQTGAQVEVVSGHEALDALGGVGVLLRYRAWGS
jgi:stalled ribosome rescue protein Dom34